MKIEKQVLSIEQMNHLKDLGVEVKDTAMVRYRRRTDIYGNRVVGKWHFVPLSEIPLLKRFEKFEIHKTLTLQEILEMLPEEITFKKRRAFLIINKEDDVISYSYEDFNGCPIIDCVYFNGHGILDNAYKMLCWVAENGYLDKE